MNSPTGSRGNVLSAHPRKLLILVSIVMAWASLPLLNSVQKAHAQSGPEVALAKKRLMVGTRETPPFSMKDNNGRWIGISIDLWRTIATELNLPYKFLELDQYNLLEGLTNGSLDVVVIDLTITSERLDMFDFTYPFYTTGLGIAVPLS